MKSLKLVGISGICLWIVGCRFVPENKSGPELYAEKCASCHGFRGEGIRHLVPAVNDPQKLKNLGDSLPCLLRYGVKGKPEQGNQAMPGFPELEADDVVALWQHLWVLAGQPDHTITLADVRQSGCLE